MEEVKKQILSVKGDTHTPKNPYFILHQKYVKEKQSLCGQNLLSSFLLSPKQNKEVYPGDWQFKTSEGRSIYLLIIDQAPALVGQNSILPTILEAHVLPQLYCVQLWP